MNAQYFLGIDLFTWDDWVEVDSGFLQFYNVEFPFESMKQFNGNSASFQLEGILEIYDEENGRVVWQGFPTQIEEFKEMLLERMWIMKNFDWDEFKDEYKKIAVHCNTEEKANDFLEQCHNKGMTWCGGDNLLSNNYWNKYRKNTCYSYTLNNKVYYSDLGYYKNEDYKIIEWEIEEETEIHSSNTETHKYILYNEVEDLYLELNNSQIKFLNFLVENNMINKFDVTELDNIEYKTI